jgi:FkbM family methyltransferase
MLRTLKKHCTVFGIAGIAYHLVSRVAGPLSIQKEVFARIPGSNKKVRVRLGTSDLDVFEEIFLDKVLETGLELGDQLIIDGGAYTGYSSVYFAERYPRCTIVAVELEESNYLQLLKNCGSYPNVTPIRAALWDRERRLRVVDTGRKNWGFLAREGGDGPDDQGQSVDAVTVSTILERFGATGIGILKLDIEGAEKRILQESGEWIQRAGCLIVELHDQFNPGCSEAFYQAIDGLRGRLEKTGTKVIFVRE